MRVCPKCGYKDSPYWKHVKFSYFVDSCSFENFEIMHPNLAKEIKEKMVSDEHNYYRYVKKSNWVLRMAKEDVLTKPFGAEEFEKVAHTQKSPYHYDKSFGKILMRENPKQTKLFKK